MQFQINIGPDDNEADQNVNSHGEVVDTRISSFYTPFYAGIETNWYKNPALDAVWKPEYDVLVERFDILLRFAAIKIALLRSFILNLPIE